MTFGSPSTTYVYGGLGYNNPIRALVDEVMHLWPKRGIACIVSIRTDMGLSKDVGRSVGPLFETLKEISTDPENVAAEFEKEMAHRYPGFVLSPRLLLFLRFLRPKILVVEDFLVQDST